MNISLVITPSLIWLPGLGLAGTNGLVYLSSVLPHLTRWFEQIAKREAVIVGKDIPDEMEAGTGKSKVEVIRDFRDLEI